MLVCVCVFFNNNMLMRMALKFSVWLRRQREGRRARWCGAAFRLCIIQHRDSLRVTWIRVIISYSVYVHPFDFLIKALFFFFFLYLFFFSPFGSETCLPRRNGVPVAASAAVVWELLVVVFFPGDGGPAGHVSLRHEAVNNRCVGEGFSGAAVVQNFTV